ncbi:MAG: histidine phosphatase family protein [Halioglobus sp.]|nr:histidine phosphatase family protein [Halioglobus sp.]
MIDIYLVRHGEAAASWGEESDPGLSDLGQQQAEAVAHRLLPVLAPDTRLLSSPLARAQETAAPLADELGRTVQLADAFREIPSPVALSERQRWLRQFMRERWPDQDKRLLQWRDTALQQLQALECPAVVFTHFLVINAVVGQLTRRSETLCFWPDNGSVTHLRLCEGQLSLVALGAQMRSVVN